jgi:hypothetical protein
VSTLARRTLIVAALAVAGVLLVWVYNNAVVGSDSTSNSRPAGVERLVPESGSDVLTQSLVGIDLADGYDADLEINGIRISNVTNDPDGDGLRKNESLGLVEYVPGPGKRVERLEPTKNCVVAHVWRTSDGPTTAKPVSWCFDAT